MRDTAKQKMHSLSAVEPADYDALRACGRDTLERLVRRVRLMARAYPRADEVESLASLIVARLHTDGSDVSKSASAACRLAARTVAEAYAGVDSLDAWADVYGADMVETVVCAGRDRAGMPRAWSPRPDARYCTTDADVIRAAVESLAGTEHGRILRDASAAYLAHGDRRCSVCEDTSTRGRRVTLAGILAHTRGLTASDSQFHAIRRAVLAAVASLDTAALRAEHYYPHAEGGRPSRVTLDREDRLIGDRAVTDTVRVWQPCERCLAVSRYALTHADARHILRRCAEGYCGASWPQASESRTHLDSHARIVGAAEERDADERRADRIGESLASAPSRAVRRANRRRSAGTGAYGSQVGARLSR